MSLAFKRLRHGGDRRETGVERLSSGILASNKAILQKKAIDAGAEEGVDCFVGVFTMGWPLTLKLVFSTICRPVVLPTAWRRW